MEIETETETETEKKSRYISIRTKQITLEKQSYTCANSPFKPALNLENYECLVWKCYNGKFDDAGYEFDHIIEYSISFDSSPQNVQALCPNCHSVKTKKFMKQKQDFTSLQIANGQQHMEIEHKKKRKN